MSSRVDSEDRRFKRESDMMAPKRLKRRPNKVASFKFPARIDPKKRVRFEGRKIEVIDKQRFAHPPRDPMSNYVGTLRLF